MLASQVEEDEDSDLQDRMDEADEVGDVSSVSSLSILRVERVRLVWASNGALRQAPHSLRNRSFKYLSLGGFAAQFRQTTLLHFRHSATKSRAHCPILLLFNNREWAPRRWSVNGVRWTEEIASKALVGTLVGSSSRPAYDMVSWAARMSARRGCASKLQRRDCMISWRRNSRRLARNWRQVHDRACRSLRSRWVAMETAILNVVQVSFVI